jgi:hypothetical protein
MNWQPIASAPQNERVLFWVRAKTADESYVNSSGEPIVCKVTQPHYHIGKYGTWSSLSTATHWVQLEPPA